MFDCDRPLLIFPPHHEVSKGCDTSTFEVETQGFRSGSTNDRAKRSRWSPFFSFFFGCIRLFEEGRVLSCLEALVNSIYALYNDIYTYPLRLAATPCTANYLNRYKQP